jgi:hypothetical protein
MIRCSLPDNDGVGYTIIITTRISDVAEQAGGVYKMKPLSSNNSRKKIMKTQKNVPTRSWPKYLTKY